MKDKSLFASVIFFFVLTLFLLIGIFSPLRAVFSPLFTAIVIIYILYPFVSFMKKKGFSGSLSTFLVGVMVLLFFCLVIVIIYPSAKDALENIYILVSDFLSANGFTISESFVSKSFSAMYTTARSIVQSSLGGIVGAAMAFYILKDTDGIKKTLNEIIPEKLKPSFRIILDDIKAITDSFFKGQIVVAVILCVLVAIFLYTLRIPYALGLGVISGILDIIPYAGAFIAMLVIICITVFTVPEMTIFVVIGLLLIQQIENHIITPKVSFDTMNLHPAIVVMVLYVGSFGGFWGILLSVPIASVIKKLFERLFQSII